MGQIACRYGQFVLVLQLQLLLLLQLDQITGTAADDLLLIAAGGCLLLPARVALRMTRMRQRVRAARAARAESRFAAGGTAAPRPL